MALLLLRFATQAGLSDLRTTGLCRLVLSATLTVIKQSTAKGAVKGAALFVYPDYEVRHQ